MFKVIILLVLYSVAVHCDDISVTSESPGVTADEITTVSGSECLYENEMWPSVDATKFYFCLPDSKTVVEQTCSTRTLFVKNQDISGCVPLSDVPSNCVYDDSLGSCTGNNLLQPQRAQYPTKYYLCLSENTDSVEMTCPPGTAFVHEKGYLGCFPWEEWRQIRGCTYDL